MVTSMPTKKILHKKNPLKPLDGPVFSAPSFEELGSEIFEKSGTLYRSCKVNCCLFISCASAHREE